MHPFRQSRIINISYAPRLSDFAILNTTRAASFGSDCIPGPVSQSCLALFAVLQKGRGLEAGPFGPDKDARCPPYWQPLCRDCEPLLLWCVWGFSLRKKLLHFPCFVSGHSQYIGKLREEGRGENRARVRNSPLHYGYHTGLVH